MPLVVNGNVPYVAVGETDYMAAPAVDDMTPPVCQAAAARSQAAMPRSCLRSRTNSPIAEDERTVPEIIRGMLEEMQAAEEGIGTAEPSAAVRTIIVDDPEPHHEPDDEQGPAHDQHTESSAGADRQPRHDDEPTQPDDDSEADNEAEADNETREPETPAQRKKYSQTRLDASA